MTVYLQSIGDPMQPVEPTKEHRWLHQLVGEWKFEGECSMGPDQPAIKNTGSERVRSLGGIWTIGEGQGDPNDEGSKSIMTLGYDVDKGRYVGTFVVGCMAYLWLYDGSLDENEKILTLDAEGPSFAGDGTMAKYQDIIEFIDSDNRTLSSRYLTPDGNWIPFMKVHYRRVS
ncbi:MAG: DUF1579 domain-containing protein [Pirellulales bacterium]